MQRRQALDRLVPVARAFDLSGDGSLVAAQPLLLSLQGVQGPDQGAVAGGGKCRYAQIDT